MFGNFAKIGRAAGASPTWQISKHHEYYYSIIVRGTSHDYLFIISMTKLDTSQCHHHILSPKPSPARLSNKIWCFCSYFHLVLLLKQNLVLLFLFTSSSSWAISHLRLKYISAILFVLGKSLIVLQYNYTAVQLMK
jgi:hypothetical protein